jgi:hypothetical protein
LAFFHAFVVGLDIICVNLVKQICYNNRMGEGKNQFKQLLQLLPEGWDGKAKELGAFQRGRKIKTPEELLRLNLLYLTEGESMAGTSAITNLLGEAAMSKPAVFKRIQNCGGWLQWICKNIYRRAGLLVEKPAWLENRNVLLIDGSEDGGGGGEKQYFMLHYCMELFTLAVREFLTTDEQTGEKPANFKKLGKGDIVAADRAYGTLTGIAHLKECGADYAIRLRGRAFNIYDEKGEKIDLTDEFSGLLRGRYGEITGWCTINGRKEALRICAVRKSVSDEQKGKERLQSGGMFVGALGGGVQQIYYCDNIRWKGSSG